MRASGIACIESSNRVDERRGGSPTLCELHHVVERRIGWKTYHIFLYDHNHHIGVCWVLNGIAIEPLRDTYWKSGLKGEWRPHHQRKQEWLKRAREVDDSFDTRASGLQKLHDQDSYSVRTYISPPSEKSSYKHLQDSWQSVRLLQPTVAIESKDGSPTTNTVSFFRTKGERLYLNFSGHTHSIWETPLFLETKHQLLMSIRKNSPNRWRSLNGLGNLVHVHVKKAE